MIESKSKKQRKKQKIKQKQEDKARDDPSKTIPKKMEDPQNNKKVRLNAHLIPIICENEENSPIQKQQLILVKNQNLNTLQEEAVSLILSKSAIRVLGKDKNIPKSISLIQRVKRVLKQKHQKQWKQTNRLGVDQQKIACFQAILYSIIMPHLDLQCFLYKFMFEIQKLIRQNKQLKDKVRAITSQLRCSKNECDIQKSVVTKAKQQNNRLILEIKELKRRQEEKKIEREQIETRYFNVLRKLQDEIEERKQKYRKLQAKIAPLMDHDSVRLQILNQVEGVHVMEVDQIKMKNNSLKDELLRLKRENYKLEHQIEQDKIQHQNEIRKIRSWANKTQQQHNLNSLTFEVCNQVENRLLLNYQQARKEAEYYKDKYFSNEKKYLQKMTHLEQEVGLLKEKCQFYEKRRERE